MAGMSRLWDILSYQNTLLDCLINYVLIVLTFPALFLTNKSLKTTLFSFIYYVIFQLSLCLWITECYGVSIVWASLLGQQLWSMRHSKSMSWSAFKARFSSRSGSISPSQSSVNPSSSFNTNSDKNKRRVDFCVGTWVLCLIALIYYAVTEDTLTSVAHVAALVMGALVSVLCEKVCRRREANERYGDIKDNAD